MTQIKQESIDYEDQNLNSGLVENVHFTISHEPIIKSETLEQTTEDFDLNQDPLQFSIKQEQSKIVPRGQKTKGKTKSQIAKEWRAKQDMGKIRQRDAERMRIKRAKIRYVDVCNFAYIH